MNRLSRFLTVGVAHTAIGLSAIFAVMRCLQMGERPANALGYAIGATFSFAPNRSWAFGDAALATPSFSRWLMVARSACLTNVSVELTAHRLFGLDAHRSQLFGFPASTAAGFFGAGPLAFGEPALSIRES